MSCQHCPHHITSHHTFINLPYLRPLFLHVFSFCSTWPRHLPPSYSTRQMLYFCKWISWYLNFVRRHRFLYVGCWVVGLKTTYSQVRVLESFFHSETVLPESNLSDRRSGNEAFRTDWQSSVPMWRKAKVIIIYSIYYIPHGYDCWWERRDTLYYENLGLVRSSGLYFFMTYIH